MHCNHYHQVKDINYLNDNARREVKKEGRRGRGKEEGEERKLEERGKREKGKGRSLKLKREMGKGKRWRIGGDLKRKEG